MHSSPRETDMFTPQPYKINTSSWWKPAVANGGNTNERARANWTELCWGDYAVRGQGTTAVYLQCVT